MKSYRPSNGTEGMIFQEMYCMNYINCDPNPEGEKQCLILCKTLVYDTSDKEYPKEWVYDENGKGICTSFQKWDWSNDGDPDDPNNPKAPTPYDPNQLVMFSVADEVLQTHDPNQTDLLTMIEEIENEKQ